ncbi:MAG: hypothetical protein LBR74_00045, partial [Eubacterium sp.]|nr:hypothetical protein [Eubacterium sp.]
MKANRRDTVFLILVGMVVSYCFMSMVLNEKIVNPLTAWHNTTLVFSQDELYAGMKDFEIVDGNRLHSTSNDPWIEVTNIRERVGQVRSVVYKVKPIAQKPAEETAVLTELYYADTDQWFSDIRRFTETFQNGATVITIPYYVGPIDKLRLDLTVLEDMTLEIAEISLNTDAS